MNQVRQASTEIRGALAEAHRREWAFVLAATVRLAGDLDVAEECVQDAFVAALTSWAQRGIPRQPRRLAHRHRPPTRPGCAAPRPDAASQAAAAGRDRPGNV